MRHGRGGKDSLELGERADDRQHKVSSLSSPGRRVSLPAALSVNSRSTGTCSSWRAGFWSKLLTLT